MLKYYSEKMTALEYLKSFFLYVFVDMIVAYLFYDSLTAVLIGIPGYIFFIKKIKKVFHEKRKNQLRQQFCEMIDSLSTALSAGLSVEHAFDDAKKIMIGMYGEKSFIVTGLNEIISKMNINKSVEKGLKEFADASGIQEITDFSEIFVHAKRSGGSFKEIISRTVRMMREKSDTEKEIEILLKGKMLEQKIMLIIPFLIMAYLRISSPQYMSVLYHNLAGIVVMSACLIIFAIAVYLTEKISNISV